ncbi:MAG: hypothetical protein IKV50_02135 [Clostridia bacterium]|nr:hypothetical protein [Clostridia bacterium]
MKRLFALLVAVLMVAGLLVLVPAAEDDELPADAIVLDYAGYIHEAYNVILAGDEKTVAELTALGHGEAKDMNYFAVIVVDVYDKVIEINTTLGRPDGVKSDMVCPENGYFIGLNGGKEGYGDIISKIQVGDSIELINVDVDEIRDMEGGHVALENAGFVVHGKPDYWTTLPITEVDGTAIDEGDVDGQLFYYPAEKDAERVVDSESVNLRYSYIIICDKNGTPLEAGNNLVFASQDTNFQNEITIPAGGFAISFYYNSDNTANQDLFDIYEDILGGLQLWNETAPVVDSTTYQFVKDGMMLAVIKTVEEEEESSEEEEESSEAPAESSEEEEESSEAPAESSEEEKTSAPATSAPATSAPAAADDGAPIGLIVGIIAGVVVIAVVVVILIKRKK